MKIRNLFRSVMLVVCLLCGLQKEISASHALSVDLTYRHLTGTNYEFTATIYFICSPTLELTYFIPLSAKSDSLGIKVASAGTLALQNPIAQLTEATSFNCTNAPICLQERVYRGMIDLANVNPTDPNASDWIFYVQFCCKPHNGIYEYDNVDRHEIYTECGLNNEDFPNGNDAPFWQDRHPNKPGHLLDTVIKAPFEEVCVNRNICLLQEVTEYDGDSLSYEFVEVQKLDGLPENYIGGYSLSYQLPSLSPPGFLIDPQTGVICFTPLTPPASESNYLVSIRVKEYRNIGGVPKQIGFVTRPMTVFYETGTCPDTSIGLDGNDIHIACNDTVFPVAVNEYFKCNTADNNASFVIMYDSATSAPVAVRSVGVDNCLYNDIANEFNVNLTNTLPFGTYYLLLKNGNDGNTVVSDCGLVIPPYRDTVKVIVDDMPVPSMLGSKIITGGRYDHIAAECGSNSIEVEFNADLQCSSIDPAGSDFLFYDSNGTAPVAIPVVSAASTCSNGETRKVTLTFSQPLTSGRFGLYLKQGTDGNTVINICNEHSLPASMPVRSPELNVDLGGDFTYCKDSLFEAWFEAPEGYSYNWNTGEHSRKIVVNTKGIYIVVIENRYGCSATDTAEVIEVICSTGVGDVATDAFILYPNPTDGTIYLKNIEFERELNISLINVNGQTVYEKNIYVANHSEMAIDISMLEEGMYYVKLSDKINTLTTTKILLMKE